jgi:hypothetical protein
MTPRNLSDKTGVSGSAISQWVKPLIKKGVLSWCDEGGVNFEEEKLLGKAKRSGKAFLYVAGGKSLPTPFQLTGDPEWDRGGTMYEAYDLHLDYVVGDLVDTDMGRDDDDLIDGAVNVISEKTNNDIKKMMKTFREEQKKCETDETEVKELYESFNDIYQLKM